MTGTRETFARIDALIGIGLRLARTAPSGRLALRRLADAIDPAWLPGELGATIAAELIAARDAPLDPVEPRRVEALLREAWGVKPAEELDELQLEPVAVTVGAQVHRAELDGEPVAVKLLRPGLAAGVRQDLALLEGLLSPLSAAFPAVDAAGLMREVRHRVLDELDLEQEAGNLRRFHRALRRHPHFVVPRPITRLAHETVLVEEWIDGVPLASAPDRDQACRRLVGFVAGGLREGLVHADPDPRDVLVLADGRIAVLDFGAVAEPDPERVGAIAELVEAFADGDDDGAAAALERLGSLPRDRAGTALDLAREVLGEFAAGDPIALDGDAVIRLRDRLITHPRAAAQVLVAGSLAPSDLWPLRGIGQLFSTIARVGATGSWREELRAALRDGWSTG